MAPERETAADTPRPARRIGSPHLTAWSLAALATGLGVGITVHESQAAWGATLAKSLRPIGQLWITALQLTVVPLVITQLVLAGLRTRRLGALGVRTLAVFLGMLIGTALLTLLVAPPLIALYRVEPATAEVLLAGVAAPETAPAAGEAGTGLAERLRDLVPPGVRGFFLGRYLLALVLGSALVALVIRRLPGPSRDRSQRGFERGSELTMQVVGAILLAAPLGVLALSFGLAQSAGGSALGLLTVFVLVTVAVTLLATALLYPLTALLGNVPVRRFAWAVAPAQVVALSSRSSLASLPALVEGGRDRLGLPADATGFVLPFAVATVKISRVISAPVMLLFLAHALGLPIGFDRLLTFVGTVLLLAFVVAGLPGRGPEPTLLPVFMAAGVPLEGVMLLETVDAIPDMFKTMLNVTSDMSAAAIVAARSGAGGSP